jgi:hypothetical protein
LGVLGLAMPSRRAGRPIGDWRVAFMRSFFFFKKKQMPIFGQQCEMISLLSDVISISLGKFRASMT